MRGAVKRWTIALWVLACCSALLACSQVPARHQVDGPAAALPWASAEDEGLSSAALARIGPWMAARVADGKVPGMVTMVARHGRVVHLESAGTLDLETGAPVADDSLFRIYSMTKPIVSVALMMLYEQGRIALEDPVAKYVPELADLKVLVNGGRVPVERPVTVADLLRHTAGFTYGIFGNSPVDQLYREADVLGQHDLAAMVRVLGRLPLQYQPGSRWHYSVATDVVGHLVERVSGQPLDRFLAEHLFAPLGMNDTGFAVPQAKIARFGTNHAFDPGTGQLAVIDAPRPGPDRGEPGFVGDVTYFSGGGGLVSTAEDYMRFCLMLAAGGTLNGVRILRPETVAMMRSDQLPAGIPGVFGGDARFGFGFAIVGDDAGRRAVGSPGSYWWFGVAGTQFWIDPVEDLIGIMLIQVQRNREPLVNEFAGLVYAALKDPARPADGAAD
ncbi:MAG: serine hydrolase domain-containing protein [Pseudomonadales bacterium]